MVMVRPWKETFSWLTAPQIVVPTPRTVALTTVARPLYVVGVAAEPEGELFFLAPPIGEAAIGPETRNAASAMQKKPKVQVCALDAFIFRFSTRFKVQF